MKKLLLTLTALSTICCAMASTPALVGQKVTPELIAKIANAKLEWGGGAMALDKGKIAYSVEFYQADNSPLLLLVLGKNENGVKTLVDDLTIDQTKVTTNKQATVGLTQKHNADGDVVDLTISLYDPTQTDKSGEAPEYFTTIYKAWKIDPSQLKLVEIPTTGLKVANERYY